MNALLRSLLASTLLLDASAALAADAPTKDAGPRPAAQEAPAEIVQKTCPVMVGNPIDPSIYSDYQGKRVYFCCAICKASFDAAPEKYLDRLPQFAKAAPSEEQESESPWASLVKPLGITTLVLLLLTASTGWFRRLKPRLLFKCHKVLALATVIAALCHTALVILFL